jgi:hypothetical protein
MTTENILRYEIPMAMKKSTVVFWVVKACSTADGNLKLQKRNYLRTKIQINK